MQVLSAIAHRDLQFGVDISTFWFSAKGSYCDIL